MGADPATLTAIASIIGAGATAGSALGLFGGKESAASAAPAPTVAPPTVMPTPDDDASKRAKQAQLSAIAQRRGRQSTILSDNTNSTDLLGA